MEATSFMVVAYIFQIHANAAPAAKIVDVRNAPKRRTALAQVWDLSRLVCSIRDTSLRNPELVANI